MEGHAELSSLGEDLGTEARYRELGAGGCCSYGPEQCGGTLLAPPWLCPSQCWERTASS